MRSYAMSRSSLKILVVYGRSSSSAHSALSKALKAAEELREMGLGAEVIPVVSGEAGRRPIIYVHGLVFEDDEKLRAEHIVKTVLEALAGVERGVPGIVSAAACFPERL